jgi:hypothetical protein
MNLPRLLFLRIRRAIQRQLDMSPAMLFGLCNPSRGLQEGRRRPDNPDKGSRLLTFLAAAALISLLCWAFTGCSNETPYLPDGTVIESSKFEIQPDTKRFLGDVARHKLGVPPRVESEASK